MNSGVTATYPGADDLLADAATAAGHDDFGPGDFHEGLTTLLTSLAVDGDLTPAAAAGVVADLRRRLANRLDVAAWYSQHPEVATLAVEGPLDITGLPRTGTTALVNMLSVDPQFRALRRWEQAQPCPPPVLGEEDRDPRRVAGQAQVDEYKAAMGAMHLFDLDASTEDLDLLGMAFHAPHFTLPAPGYHEWWRNADMTESYAYHRQVLQLLQSRRPPDRWLLKAPHHTFHLEAVAAAYPDTRFVVTHRDPVRSVPSWASVVATVLPEPEQPRDLHRIGQACSAHLQVAVERMIAGRAAVGEDRFLDVHHRELVADPMGTVRRIYEWVGLDLTPESEAAIAAWNDENRSGSHGTHRYTAEEFGLSAGQLRADFDTYVRHFDVELES
jgi:hypothetical protein